jgi:hypothetical protein
MLVSLVLVAIAADAAGCCCLQPCAPGPSQTGLTESVAALPKAPADVVVVAGVARAPRY